MTVVNYVITFRAASNTAPTSCEEVGSRKALGSVYPAPPSGQTWNQLQLGCGDTVQWAFQNDTFWSRGSSSDNNSSFYTQVEGLEVTHYKKITSTASGPRTRSDPEALPPQSFSVTAGTAQEVLPSGQCTGAPVSSVKASSGDLKIEDTWWPATGYGIALQYRIWFKSIKGPTTRYWHYDPEIDMEPQDYTNPGMTPLDPRAEPASPAQSPEQPFAEGVVREEVVIEYDEVTANGRRGSVDYREDVAILTVKYPDVDWDEVFRKIFGGACIHLK